MSGTSLVTLEVIRIIWYLIRKFVDKETKEDPLTWDLILDITAALVTAMQVSAIRTQIHRYAWFTRF